MTSFFSRVVVGVACVLLPGVTSAAGQPSKVEIAKQGKAATALVERVDKRFFLPAVCVHPSGLFLTRSDIVRSAEKAALRIVLNPGVKSEKTLPAKVVRFDHELNLALVRALDQKDLPTLALGGEEGLAELIEVYAIGFPTSQWFPKKEYPTSSLVNATVTSLRYKDAELERIHLDGLFKQANTGGPLLDKTGKLVGWVAGRGDGNSAVAQPVSALRRFVSRPELEFTPPAITHQNLHKPTLFELRAVPVMPSAKPLTVELRLTTEDGMQRSIAMKPVGPEGERYGATVAPVPPPADSNLRLTVDFPEGLVTGTTVDRAFKVGAKELRLRAVSRLRLAPKPHAVLHNGETRFGSSAGLEAVPVRLDKTVVTLNLAKATEVRFDAPTPHQWVNYTIVVSQDGKEVARLRNSIAVERPYQTVGSAMDKSTLLPPKLDKDPTIVTLAAPLADVAVGGGGRYLIFHLAKVRKLAVFDVNQAKVVATLPVDEDNIKLAAGKDKLIVALRKKRSMERWSLKTFEHEISEPLPFAGDDLKSMALGSNSDGPILLVHLSKGARQGEVTFVDLLTLKSLPLKRLDKTPILHVGEAHASAGGRVFGLNPLFGGGAQTVMVFRNDVAVHNTNAVGAPVLPGPDGAVILTSNGLYTNYWRLLTDRHEKQLCLPAAHGPFYLSFKLRDKMIALNVLGSERSLAHLAPAEPRLLHGQAPNAPGPRLEKRFIFLPDAKLLILIPPTNDRLILQQVDMEQALGRVPGGDLLVTTQPSSVARKGLMYKYQIVAKTRHGGLRYTVERGPPQMEVTAQGLVQWPVPAELAAKEVPVVLSVRDVIGEERLISFKLKIQ
jgi:hypothetical protein